VCAENEEPIAQFIQGHLAEKCLVFSLVQGEASWWAGRIFRLSGSQSHRWVHKVLEVDRPHTVFPRILSRTAARAASGTTTNGVVTPQVIPVNAVPVLVNVPSETASAIPVNNIAASSAPAGLSVPNPISVPQPVNATTSDHITPAEPRLEVIEIINLNYLSDLEEDEGDSDEVDSEDHDRENHLVDGDSSDDEGDARLVNASATPQPGTQASSSGVVPSLATANIATVAESLSTSDGNMSPVPGSSIPVTVARPTMDQMKAKFLEDFTKASFVLKNLDNDGILRGKMTEARTIAFASKFFDGRRVYSLGVVHKLSIRHAVASPDGIGLYKGKITLLEAKCSVSYTPNIDLNTVLEVEAGSEDFFRLIPNQYICQILHEVTILGVNQIMVVLSHPSGVSSMVLVHFSDEIVNDYASYLNCDLYKLCFNWFDDNVNNPNVSDADFLKKIPSFATVTTRRILETQAVLLRAVYGYRQKIGVPVEPTRSFREYVTDAYNNGKGGVDTECKQVVRATKGNNLVPPFRQRYTMRLVYFPLVATARIMALMKEVRRLGVDTEVKWTIKLKNFRRRLNGVPLNDRLFDIGQKIRDSRLPLGSIYAGSFQQPPLPVVEPKFTVTAALPEAMQIYVKERAKRYKRQVTRFDYLIETNFVVSENSYSPSTPNGLIYNESHIARSRKLVAIFDQRPKTGSQRATRVAYWTTVGLALRSSTVVAHIPIRLSGDDVKQTRPHCFSCKSKPAAIEMCILCGEQLCLSCWSLFHSSSVDIKEENGVPTPQSTPTSNTTDPRSSETTIIKHQGKTWSLKTPTQRKSTYDSRSSGTNSQATGTNLLSTFQNAAATEAQSGKKLKESEETEHSSTQ